MLGGWRDDLHQAGLMARTMALAIAQIHLAAGRDVIVPQFLGRRDFLEQLERIAWEAGGEFREVVLLDSWTRSAS